MAKKHDLTPQEKVAISGYYITGDLLTAYTLLRPKSTANKDSLQRQAARWLRQPDCAAYLNDIKAAQARRIRENTDGDTPDLTDRDNLLAELQLQYRTATDPKSKADILNKIADICKMKQAETPTEDENRVHYYLPLRCDICPYNPKNKDKDDNEGE